MTDVVYNQEGGKKISVSQANQLLILKIHLWIKSNHLTKSSNHLLARGGKLLSKSNSRKNNGCSNSDGSHEVHNNLNDFQVFLMIKIWISCNQGVILLPKQCHCIIFMFIHTISVLTVFLCTCFRTVGKCH